MKKKWNNPGSQTSSEYYGIYNSWRGMFDRINNKRGKSPTYSDVTVCKEWYDYDIFFEWSIKNGWKKGLVLDKDIIKPGNRVYCPEYCKWVSKTENTKEVLNRIGNPMKNPEISVKFSGDNSPMKRDDVKAKITGSNNYNAKKVICIETGKIFGSARDAERYYNIPKNTVSAAINPKQPNKTAGGYHWQYVKEE